MMKLHVNETQNVDPTFPVRWCITPEERAELVQRNIPLSMTFVLIVVIDRKTLEREGEFSFPVIAQYVIPVEKGMTYITLPRSGKLCIYSQLIYGERFNIKRLFGARESNGTFRCSVFDEYKRLRESYHSSEKDLIERNVAVAIRGSDYRLDVVVDPRFFAKKPWRLEDWWVNLWFETPPRDQCHFRKRRLVAYTIQPPVMAVVFAIMFSMKTAIFLFRLMLGMRFNNWRVLILVHRYGTRDLWGPTFWSGGSFFFTDENGKIRYPIWWIWCPAVLMVLLGGVFLMSLFKPSMLVNNEVFVPLLLYAFALGVCLSIFVLIAHVLLKGAIAVAPYVGNVLEDQLEKLAQRRREAEEAAERLRPILLEKSYSSFVCPADEEPAEVSVRTLPRQQRTAKLYFQALKARVCRPYAR